MKNHRSEDNSKEYDEFLDTYKTDDNLPYYLYSGQKDTRDEHTQWQDIEAYKNLSQIAPTGSIYLRHDKIEMLCRVTDNPESPGFIINCKDENGIPREFHVYFNSRTARLIVCTSRNTDARSADKEIYESYPLPFRNIDQEE